MTSIIKVDNIQDVCGSATISKCGTTITIGASGDTVTLAAGASQSGFGRTGTVNWDTTKKTTGFTSVSGNGYFCDTTSSAFTATLPATPSAGDIVAFSDYTGTWTTNNITVGRNGSNINATAADLILNGNNTTATFIYVDATEGWRIIDTGSLSEVNVALYISATGGTITTSGDYKTHIFTGPGTFTVCSVGNTLGSNSVDYAVVAGGGGGGYDRGGGGGAGGLRSSTSLPVSVQGYPITIGAGGAGGTSSPVAAGGCGTSSIFSTITSAGGGGGGSGTCSIASKAGGSGAGGHYGPAPQHAGAAGNTPPVSPPQGNPGGNFAGDATTYASGGGGGASAVGGNGISPPGGAGGAGGAGTNISPTFGPGLPNSGIYAGGGGGGASGGPSYTPGPGGAGGTGGGGAGATGTAAGTPGTINTGGGGGSAGFFGTPFSGGNGGAGGSGIVIIRYKYQ